jgi:phage minor structural protein
LAQTDHRFIIYENDALMFDTFGLSVINDAYQIELKQVLNGEHSLSFSIPRDSISYKFITIGRFIKAYETIYIIRSIEEYSQPPAVQVKIYCEHIMFELLDEFIPFLTHQNSTAQYILSRILNGTRFKGTTNITGAYNLQVTRGSKLKNINELCENVDGIRIPSNMPDENGYFHINIIPSEGIDNGILVHNRKNMSSIKRIINGMGVVTRLYVYGEEGLGIENATKSGKKAFIDADNIQDFPRPKEGAVSFDTINEPNSLYEAGLKYLKTVNKPIVSYEVEMQDLVDISGKSSISIGDIITVIDEELDVRVKVKVTELAPKPEEGRNKVSLEQVIPSADQLIASILNDQETETGIRKGNVWTEWLTVPFTNEVITINFSQEYRTQPVVNAQVYGTKQEVYMEINPISQITEGITVFTGVSIHCPSGTGNDIAVQAIGRI